VQVRLIDHLAWHVIVQVRLIDHLA